MISSTIFYKREKKAGVVKLSLVALMDIFTILVFFLLLNSGEAQKIENAKFVELPDSTTGNAPHEQLMIMVNEEEIWLAKAKIAEVSDVLRGPQDTIEPLALALAEHTKKLENEITPFQEENGLAVIIMADKEVPYVLLKSVMATCRLENYRNISLAVNRIVGSSDTVFSLPTDEAVQAAGEGT